MKYRKKPVIIEAKQVSLDNLKEIAKWSGGSVQILPFGMKNGLLLVVETLEGDLFAKEKDWIIKGVKGEFYPCKPDIFEATYEQVTD